VVICPTYSVERPPWFVRESELAIELARRGNLTLRFDYRGQGLSPIDEPTTLASLRADISTARVTAAGLAGNTPLAVVGIGLGGLVAALRPEGTSDPLALWDPTSGGDSFLADLARQRVIKQMGFDPSAEDTTLLDRVAEDLMTEELDRDGFCDILGFRVNRTLVESLRGLDQPDLGVRQSASFGPEDPVEAVSSWVAMSLTSI
jgi:pimeloyl-ACP methyl ester carboxylesterase